MTQTETYSCNIKIDILKTIKIFEENAYNELLYRNTEKAKYNSNRRLLNYLVGTSHIKIY